MQKHLYFICPTDHLERVISRTSSHQNYFMTSLGNYITLDTDTIDHINAIVETNQIEEITFVLSKDNEFFKGENRIDLHEMTAHLNKKMRELKSHLSSWFVDQININAQIYNRQNGVFVEAHRNLFKLDDYCLN